MTNYVDIYVPGYLLERLSDEEADVAWPDDDIVARIHFHVCLVFVTNVDSHEQDIVMQVTQSKVSDDLVYTS